MKKYAVKLILRWKDSKSKESFEEINILSDDPNFPDAYWAAYYLGYYYQTEILETYEGQFNQLFSYNADVTKVQSYFIHQIDEFLNEDYELGIFPETITIENPIIIPKPPTPQKGLEVILQWMTKDNYTEVGRETFLIKDLDVQTFGVNLWLTNESFPYATGSWFLDGWFNSGQDWYLYNLYEQYGQYITHVTDTSQWYYHLDAHEVG